MAENASKFQDPISRINYDFELLYKQQLEFQKLTKQFDVPLVQMKSKFAPQSYADVSLHCLTVTNSFRQLIINIVLNVWFDRFILFVIIGNCVTLALDDQISDEEGPIIEMIFLVIFTIEMTLKIIAMGFVTSANTYLRDPWNILDFVVVIVGWMGLLIEGGNISAIRTVRILRPLRTVNSLPEMKVLVVAILNSIPVLCDIFVLFLFILLVFSIVGTQLYAGQFRERCTNGVEIIDDFDGYCHIEPDCDGEETSYDEDCESRCPDGMWCIEWYANPNSGVTSMDNTLVSALTIFVSITLEGWSDLMYMGRDFSGNMKEFNDIFFIIIVIIGAFFLINLIAAVLFVKFHDSVQGQKDEEDGAEEMIEVEEEDDDPEPVKPDVPENTCWFCWYKFRIWHFKLVQGSTFNWAILVLIMVNTGIMASEYHEMTSEHEEFVEISNIVLNVLFALEMALKLIGLGFRGYIEDRFNIFDGTIVIIGLIEIIFLSGSDDVRGLIVLRAFRLLRIFKLARGWTGLRLLLEKIIKATASIAYLGLLALLCLFIFALMGKQFFGGVLEEDGETPRSNFDNLYWAFVTIFEVLTGENWNEVMYTAVDSTTWLASLYFIALIVVGNYILLNLFLAILLEEFEEDDEEEEPEEILSAAASATLKSSRLKQPEASMVNKKQDEERRNKLRTKLEAKGKGGVDPLPLRGKSYKLFGETNRLRLFLKEVMLNPYFDAFIYGLIGLSSLLLALGEPTLPDYTERVLAIGDKVILILFIIEFIIKSIVLGFCQGKKTYLKNGWNKLDFFIIVISCVDWILELTADGAVDLSFLRALRALRALRMVSHNETMKKVVTSVFRALPVVANVMLISLLFYLIFGILGVIFFKGGLYRCEFETDDGGVEEELYTTEEKCEDPNGEYNGTWKNADVNFDNIANSMLTLFEISTLEMWPDFMYEAIDVTEPGEPMEKNNNPLAALYFILFIFLTAFFIMNLYVGVIIKKFNEIQEELDGSFFLNADQKEWVKTEKLLSRCSPKIKYQNPPQKWRKVFFDLVLDYKFDYSIMSIISMNILFMTLFHYDMDDTLDELLVIGNYVFVGIFTVEFILKFTGLGFKYYFASAWNEFDFIILVLSYFSIFEFISFFNATVLRALRIARLFRMIKMFKGFRKVFQTLIVSLPSLINVGALLLLLYFVYGVAGMGLFGDIVYQDFITRHANFRSFYDSINTLFRASTGESWNGLMHDCMGRETCEGDCGSPVVGSIYWVSFNVLAAFVFLNIFIAIILDNFEATNQEETSVELCAKDLKKYVEAWSEFAPYGEHFIDTIELPRFLEILESPLGFKGQKLSKAQLLSLIDTFNIKDHDGKVHFAEVLWALSSAVSGADMKDAAPCEAMQILLKVLPEKFPSLPTKPNMDFSNMTSSEGITASKVLAAWIIFNGWKTAKEERIKNMERDERERLAEDQVDLFANPIVMNMKENTQAMRNRV